LTEYLGLGRAGEIARNSRGGQVVFFLKRMVGGEKGEPENNEATFVGTCTAGSKKKKKKKKENTQIPRGEKTISAHPGASQG